MYHKLAIVVRGTLMYTIRVLYEFFCLFVNTAHLLKGNSADE